MLLKIDVINVDSSVILQVVIICGLVIIFQYCVQFILESCIISVESGSSNIRYINSRLVLRFKVKFGRMCFDEIVNINYVLLLIVCLICCCW